MVTEKIILNEERGVTLTTYLHEISHEYSFIDKRPAVLVIPGGGYHLCSMRESEPAALAFLNAGFNAFVLRYSVYGDNNERPGNADWPNPLKDYEQAMRLIRENADKWNILPDKLAVIGFSAGGHLAAAGMTMAEEDTKPNAAILGYPVTHWGENKYGVKAPDIMPAVKEDNCPCFIFATRTDPVVPVINSIELIETLSEKGVPFESHIYSTGPHGYSTCAPWLEKNEHCARVPDWVGDSIEWLRETLDVLN